MCIKGAVAYESIPSQNIAQLLNNKSLDYNFIPTCRELNSLSILCGLWFVVTCYAGGRLKIGLVVIITI